jgi:hypothetical protein
VQGKLAYLPGQTYRSAQREKLYLKSQAEAVKGSTDQSSCWSNDHSWQEENLLKGRKTKRQTSLK